MRTMPTTTARQEMPPRGRDGGVCGGAGGEGKRGLGDWLISVGRDLMI